MYQSYPHRCFYGHTWQVALPDTLNYFMPQRRFCAMCLEEKRISVGAVQLPTRVSRQGIQLVTSTCQQCNYTTYIPLHPLEALDFAELDLTDDYDSFKERWYQLPSRWPRCFHCDAELIHQSLQTTLTPETRQERKLSTQPDRLKQLFEHMGANVIDVTPESEPTT